MFMQRESCGQVETKLWKILLSGTEAKLYLGSYIKALAESKLVLIYGAGPIKLTESTDSHLALIGEMSHPML
jgi:hypothetical protein